MRGKLAFPVKSMPGLDLQLFLWVRFRKAKAVLLVPRGYGFVSVYGYGFVSEI